jgi:hypothetical protein
MTDLRPIGRELAWRNRRILAERLGWPAGALEECERIERERPGWSPWWQPANAWAGKAAGYYARRPGESGPRFPEPYGATPAELVEAMDKAPERRW